MNHPSRRHGSVGISMIVDDFFGFRLEDQPWSSCEEQWLRKCGHTKLEEEDGSTAQSCKTSTWGKKISQALHILQQSVSYLTPSILQSFNSCMTSLTFMKKTSRPVQSHIQGAHQASSCKIGAMIFQYQNTHMQNWLSLGTTWASFHEWQESDF